MRLCMCTVCVKSSLEAREEYQIPDTVELELTGRCELPKMDPGNWTLALWKSKLCSYSWASQPASVVVLIGSVLCMWVNVCAYHGVHMEVRGELQSQVSSLPAFIPLPSKNQTQVLRPDLQVLLPIPVAHLTRTR